MGNLLKLYTLHINISLSKNVKSFKIYMHLLDFIYRRYAGIEVTVYPENEKKRREKEVLILNRTV